MSTEPVRRKLRAAGFTLLEITLAVAILAMMSLSIYRFVQANLTTLKISSDETAAESRYAGLINLLTSQFQDIVGSGSLTGEPLKFNDRPRDEITWYCAAGPGLLTRYASGEFQVTMRLRPSPDKRDTMQLGFSRSARGTSGSAPADEGWFPLLDDVRSMQIRYFDPRLNAWVDRWTDTVTLPRLVRLVIGRPDRSLPWETIIALGRTPL